jgi:amino acid permease
VRSIQKSTIPQKEQLTTTLKVLNESSDDCPNKGGTIPQLTTSLVKSIVGSGILALPAGVSTLGDSPDVVLPALVIIAAIGGINAFFFSLIGRVCSWTGATSYRDAWERTMGPESSQSVAIVVTLKTALSCLAYSMILADSFQALGIAAGLVDIT